MHSLIEDNNLLIFLNSNEDDNESGETQGLPNFASINFHDIED